MQSRTYIGPYADRNPDFTGVPWSTYGDTASHIDSDDTTGYQANAIGGGQSLAHAMVLDDGVIPQLSTIRALQLGFSLGADNLVAQSILPVVPFVRYEGGPPVFLEEITPPHAVAFSVFTTEFTRDPDGFPWTRASIFRKRGKTLLFGLRSGPAAGVTANVQWSETRFTVVFDLPIPFVQTDPASLIGATSALLNGRVNPKGANGTYPISYWFEWGLTTSYGTQTTPVTGVTGDVTLHVAEPITGLTTAVGYHFRLVVQTPDGTFTGDDVFFSTDPQATGRFRLDEFKRVPTGQWLAGDRTRLTSPGFDRPSTATDNLGCPYLVYP